MLNFLFAMTFVMLFAEVMTNTNSYPTWKITLMCLVASVCLILSASGVGA